MSFFHRTRRTDTRLERLENRTAVPTTTAGTPAVTGGGGLLPVHDHLGSSDGGVLTGAKHDAADDFLAIATPSTPAASHLSIYAKISGGFAKLFYKQSDGTEVGPLGAGGSGAPHNLLDGGVVHLDATLDSVSRGSLIVGNSTPAWDELIVGAANTVLMADGTDVMWQTLGQIKQTYISFGSVPVGGYAV